MVGLVTLAGIMMVAVGAIYLVKPVLMKKVMRFWTKGARIYLGGILSLLFGVIFLITATECALTWFIVLLGILSLIKGVLLFVLGPKKILPLVERLTKGPQSALRVFAIVAIAMGVLLIYAT